MAGLSLFLLLVVGLLARAQLTSEPYSARPPSTPTGSAQPALATEALHVFERAVTDDDEAAARALAPTGDDRSANLLAAVVRNAHALRVRDFTLRYVDEQGAVSADGSWAAAVDATWAFARFDPAPARAEVLFRFVAGDDRVALAAIGGGDRRTPVWLAGPVEVRRTPTTLVVVSGSPAQADGYAARAVAAIPVVRRVLPRWRPRLVVEVPGSASGLDQALDAAPGEYAAIAAVTTTVDGSLAPDAPVHVFVNPEVFGGLLPQGAQVVMSHETVHVATNAALSAMPLWLLEGFADYVALRDVHLPLSTTAGQVIRQVRRDGLPRTLPGATEFDTAAPHLGAAYEAAWLACRVVAEQGGEAALVRLYQQVDGGRPLAAALRRSAGLGERELVRDWRDRLAQLAS